MVRNDVQKRIDKELASIIDDMSEKEGVSQRMASKLIAKKLKKDRGEFDFFNL